jgi:hypothetical protein
MELSTTASLPVGVRLAWTTESARPAAHGGVAVATAAIAKDMATK